VNNYFETADLRLSPLFNLFAALLLTAKINPQMLKTELFTPCYQNFDSFIQRSEATMTAYARDIRPFL